MSAQSEVFDPGIDDHGDEDTELVLDAVGDLVRNHSGRPLSVREGHFDAGGTSVLLFKVLFDTGALHKSYVSAIWLRRTEKSGRITSFRIEL